jgi:hypothetical protein
MPGDTSPSPFVQESKCLKANIQQQIVFEVFKVKQMQ